jgi:hypothetical protein
MIVMLVTAVSLSLGLPQAMSAASAAPAVHLTAGVPAAAKAAAASTDQTGSHSVGVLSAGTHVSSLTGGAIPLISWKECPSLRTTWVDIDMVNIGAGVISDWCFGYTGTWRFSTNTGYYVSYFCSGNNKGSFAYTYGGVYHIFFFGPGRLVAFPAATLPVSLTITGWSVSDTCIS